MCVMVNRERKGRGSGQGGRGRGRERENDCLIDSGEVWAGDNEMSTRCPLNT